ncbi:glycosyltransferase family 4 protein [Paeniroseomonas aquatica]|uniref:Glycosyltransferase family 4 protein n=1 Tax=Paeniroseomonas aquatica TaxID=373043 RepID=A0ABT8AF98_9PROT|nr:glycosyltransferase family 4 protein [Paeniroseomonas aquatica]MDN3568492.1 glycosyltransferase family 4 protein [Paeniroseomonas aquatica]
MGINTRSVFEPPARLKILHVINHTRRANGNVCAMVDLACTQAAQGHDVSICSAGGDFDELFTIFGIRHLKVDQNRKPKINLVKALWSLRRVILNVKPDIVHAHMMTSAMLAAALCVLKKPKLVTTVHNEFEKSAVLMRVGDRVIGVSEVVTQSMIRRGVPKNKIRTVLNGTVNSPRFSSILPSPRTLPSPAIIFVGGLHPRKGVDDLIKAHGILLESCPRAHLFIIGGGPHEHEYRKLADTISESQITFCGHSNDPREFLLAGDIFVLPSHADPAPLVLSEARAAGCAIVATDVGGIPEMLENGKAGVLVQPKRPDLLAAALVRLLKDPQYLAEMRAKSQINISRLKLDRVSQQTVAVYQEILADGWFGRFKRFASVSTAS